MDEGVSKKEGAAHAGKKSVNPRWGREEGFYQKNE